MLDSELHDELRNANKTALVLHISMLSQPLIYVIIALVLREMSHFKGLDEFFPGLPLMRFVFFLVSVLVIPGHSGPQKAAVFTRQDCPQRRRCAKGCHGLFARADSR